MDLYAYSQIDNLEQYLKDNNIEVPRLRGLRLMKEEEAIPASTVSDIITEAKKDYLVNWLQQHDDFGWASWKADKKHPAFIYGKDENGRKEIVDYDFSKVHGKDRKHIKFGWKQVEKRYTLNLNTFNEYVGKNVLYVHSRLGGGNRPYYSLAWENIRNHPLYLDDCDDPFDTTYCDIYFKLEGEIK